MKILALETSCDETAVAVVEDGRWVLSSIIHTQIETHARYGGVLPEIAARQHLEGVNLLVAEALAQAGLTLNDMDAVAATLGPGLIGALLVGAHVAKTLSLIAGKPFLGVHHLFAHVASNYLESDLEPPFLCLLVSGGHTQLIHVTAYDTMEILGESLDDAVGEAYDKVARLMGLGFPGGPALDRLAPMGDPKAYTLPKAKTTGKYDFSFSGVKTACLRIYEKAMAECPHDTALIQANLAAAFQATVVDTLFEKTLRCAQDLGVQTLAIAGGVSANRGLRERFHTFAEKTPGVRVSLPSLQYCTDNAAMVGASAYFNPLSRNVSEDVFSRGMPTALR